MIYSKNKRIITYKSNYDSRANIQTFWSINYYVKIFFAKISFFLFVFLSIAMLVLSSKNNIIENKIKNFVFVISKPQIYLFNKFSSLKFYFKNEIYYLYDNKYKILELQSKNIKLTENLINKKAVEDENTELKGILNYITNNFISDFKIIKFNFINNNIFSNKIFINYGFKDNLKENDYVIDKKGNLIGRIINLQENNSEILLITDIDSKISVKTEKSKLNLILSGNKSKYLNIEYILGEEYNFKENENVYIYSERKEILNVGKVVKIKNKFKVESLIKFNQMNYGIVIIDHAS